MNDRPIAMHLPRHDRPQTMSVEAFFSDCTPADPALLAELDSELAEMTDELDDPWQT